MHLSCIGQKITYFLWASGKVESNKGNSSIIGDEEINIEGRAASFLLPQKLREDDGASIQHENQKTYDGAMQNMGLGQNGVKCVGGNKCLNLQRWRYVN